MLDVCIAVRPIFGFINKIGELATGFVFYALGLLLREKLLCKFDLGFAIESH